jgi:hypothetical protein
VTSPKNKSEAIDQPIIAPRSVDVQWSERVRAREMIGPVNSPLTGQSTCLFNGFGERTKPDNEDHP